MRIVAKFSMGEKRGDSYHFLQYGGSGLRRKKVENETTTWYNYFGYDVIAEEDGSGGGIGAGGELVQTYVHDPGKAIGTIIQSSLNDTYFWYHQDHIGSTRLLTSPDRATVASYEYTPYGEPLSLSGWFWVNSYMFTGKELDYATGNYFFPYRYYSPGTARWLTRDPLGMVDGPNMHSYVACDPTNRVDPIGGFLLPAPGDSRKCREVEQEHPFPPGTSDKYRHCVLGCEIAKEYGPWTAATCAHGKECVDLVDGDPDTHPDQEDIDASIDGIRGAVQYPAVSCRAWCRYVGWPP